MNSSSGRQHPQESAVGGKRVQNAKEQRVHGVGKRAPILFTDVRTESKQERTQRLRKEKNRRNQQAFRDRCRVGCSLCCLAANKQVQYVIQLPSSDAPSDAKQPAPVPCTRRMNFVLVIPVQLSRNL